MNTPDPIEKALEFVEGPGRPYTGTSARTLADEVRRLREVEKALLARNALLTEEIHLALQRESHTGPFADRPTH